MHAPRSRTEEKSLAEDQVEICDKTTRVLLALLALALVCVLLKVVNTEEVDAERWRHPQLPSTLNKDEISMVTGTDRMARLMVMVNHLFENMDAGIAEQRAFLRKMALRIDRATDTREPALSKYCIESRMYSEDTCVMRSYLYIAYRSDLSIGQLGDKMDEVALGTL